MAGSILGMDIADGRAVLVQLAGSGRGSVRARAVVELPDEATPADIARAVADCVAREKLASDAYVLGLGAGQALLRTVTFPFTGSARIAKALPFELEQRFPVAVEELVPSWIEGDRVADGCRVLVAALRREVLAAHVEAFTAQGLAPKVVDIDACALGGVLPVLDADLPAEALVVHVGERSSRVMVLSGATPVFLRAIETGMDALRGGTAEVSAMVDGDGHVAVEPAALERLGRDVRAALALAAESVGLEPACVVLCGPGVRVAGLDAHLGELLGLPVRRPEVPSDVFAAFPGVGNAELPDYLVAWGLALRGARKVAGFDFRTGEFAYVDPRGRRREMAVWAGGLILMMLLGLGASWGAGVHRDLAQLEAGRERIRQIFHEVLPDVQGNFSVTQYRSILKSRMAELESHGREGARGGALDVLLAVTRVVPDKMPFTLSALSMDDTQISLSGTAGGFATVEDVKKRLEASGAFREVSIRSAQAEAKGKGVRFELVIRRES
ncbi:Tfp pilus assembly PilM family ATPase [Desulfobaculum xiamenense]|uniref:Tfp pilus assembly PilM family ATPase n=1 Tax=Desulfobaculum xiamenense TaxID=995050 RepID=A0A846QQI4_9BACT|nr:pilus assembly protein PilM [Desulfobaculum xiamenense]NJB68762.1 Tfp pilus assembly PilM family ATPase [Desulfobaculum xiamenense]